MYNTQRLVPNWRILLIVFIACISTLALLIRYGNTDVNAKEFEVIKRYNPNNTNDVAVYTPSVQGTKNWHFYDAGFGIDTLWLRVSQKEFEHPAIRADLIRFYYYLLNSSQPLRPSGKGPKFSFAAFELILRNFENVIVEDITGKVIETKLVQPVLKKEDILTIPDSSYDSLI